MIFTSYDHYISDFIKKYNKVCSGNTIKSHDSFSLAKEHCEKETLCNGIFDVGCEGKRFWTCTGTMELAFITKFKNLTYVNVSISTCAWEKGKICMNNKKALEYLYR